MHDGTVHGFTVRISQKEESYVRMVRVLIIRSGGHACVYREGAAPALFVVEFSRSFLGPFRPSTIGEFAGYARGFFDAEGGVPRDPAKGAYVYFAQEDRAGLASFGTSCCGLTSRAGRCTVPVRRSMLGTGGST